MNFEFLPNEIILDLFEYIPIFDLFHGFFDLNPRFRELLCVQFHRFHLDLRLLSKTKCDHICQNIIPLIIDRIISLHLSNDDNTPQQIQYFLFHQYQLRQFTHLQSISLSSIGSPQILEQILIECSYLPCLTHLSFHNDELSMSIDDAQCFFSYIWKLQKLTYCYLNMWFYYAKYIYNLGVITSTSLRYLIVQNSTCSASKLAHWNQYTPNLERLSITFRDNTDQLKFMTPFLLLTLLKMDFSGSMKMLEHLLQHMPNLCHLRLEINGIFINGYQWEEIIRKYLPKLKIFQFKMDFLSSNEKNEEEQLNEIIDTFRTKFWIVEHQWFVRCYWCKSSELISLSSPPYTFPMSTICTLSKSTYPFDDEYLSYDRVTHLYYRPLHFTDWMVSNVRLFNVQHLELPLPFNDQFLRVVPKLDRLRSLTTFVENDENLNIVPFQLQYLLDQATCLRSLSFGEWSLVGLHVPSIGFTSVSVRHLILQRITYHDEQCMQLSRSPLGRQCETLSITVKYRRNIVELINNMPQLQALVVRCKESESTMENNSMDDFVEWLRKQLPSTCMIMESRYNNIYDFRIWIR